MKITFDENGEVVHYRIHNFDKKYEPILQSCFYQQVENGYIKIYPRHAKYLDNMMVRYAAHAQEMFDQLGYFQAAPWEKGLEQFCQKIDRAGIDWWLTGSCAACIRGIELQPHDIDIMIDSKDVENMTELFQDVLIEPIVDTHGWVTKDFGVIFMDVRIDIASDPDPILDHPDPIDCGPYARDHIETLHWNGHDIRIPPIELQITANKKRGRHNRVKKMEEYVRNHPRREINRE